MGGLQEDTKGTRQLFVLSGSARLEGRCMEEDALLDEDSQDDLDCGRFSVELDTDDDISGCS